MKTAQFIQSIFSDHSTGQAVGSMSRVNTFIIALIASFVTVYQVVTNTIDHALILQLWSFAIAAKNIGKYLEKRNSTVIASSDAIGTKQSKTPNKE